jgi:hypothetical protein
MYHVQIEHQKLDFKPNYMLYVKLPNLRMQAYKTYVWIIPLQT